MKKYLFITTYGRVFHYILVYTYSIYRKFDHTNKKFKKNMLQLEESEVTVHKIS